MNVNEAPNLNPERIALKVPVKLGFDIKVVYANALSYATDLLILAYPQEWTTLGKQLVSRMPPGSALVTHPPGPGESQSYPSNDAIKARSILVIGTVPHRQLTYDTLRDTGRRMLVALHEAGDKLPAENVAVTVFGSGWGFDEVESFRAMLFGFVSAVQDELLPPQLKRLTVLEHRLKRANVLSEALDRFWKDDARTFPAESRATADNAPLSSIHFASRDPVRIEPDKQEPIEPIASLGEPSIFVAMPYAPRYDDVYYYAILPAVKANNAQCIRLDKVAYTGDVIETIKTRIAAARLVLAMLDSLNPNVFLEIGYSWGVGTPTLLLIGDDQLNDKLPFDVVSQRYVRYDSIRTLADRLPNEIKAILSGLPANPAAKHSSPH